MIAVLPFAVHFSSGQAAAATHSACSIPSVQIPVGLSRLPLVRCLGASPTMWSQWPETLHTPRWKHHSQLHAGKRRHVSVVAACLPVAGCRPPSLQCGMTDGGPIPCERVDVQWEIRSTRCAVTSGNETLRPLLHFACAGSSDSSISMPLGVAARSSPAVVDGEQPSRSSWCEFRPQITAAGHKRRMVLITLSSVSNCRGKAAEVHRVNAGAGRWAHAEGGGLQAVGATSYKRSHGKVWRTKKATPPARPPHFWWKSPQPMSLVAGAHWCLHSCRRTMPGWCCASRAARAILRGEGPEFLSCEKPTRPYSPGLRLLRTPPQRVMPTE
ncbi:hypothetical protein TcYC6_0020330 [Trypanosoma cruzi]|uniref:Uncharacterized protein n=1 Tax=Trypanosoma cruzi TaxID=5693 RepID=A0A7J6XY41_TRYCR|nr:hypothetical protein ECC02_007999 [Trypanosoma cruzi]KAF8286468.1 hypothetical protein TcYC6_0020330 [Trypanosoma cruzi]